MEKHNYLACCYPETRHPHDYDLDHKNCLDKRCCSHKCSHHQGCHDRCCCSCHRSRCRKDLCDTDFKIRLAGLQDGLNFRLRKQLWCEAEFELDNGNKVKGTIVFVGSNFVEILVDKSLPLEDGDKDLTQKPPVEEKEHDACEIRKHTKGRTWIFSIDKIANVILSSSEHQCMCH
jgi:hypothetical protein